ncbi:MAG: zinc-dependent peptidase [Saprospiraceae bacterium]
MLSKILIAPFIICAIVFTYLTLEVNDKYSWYIVPNVVVMAVLYILSPQIDWWWYQRRPPKLPDGLVKMFMTRIPFFDKLTPADKTKFCNRVALYMEANEFMPKGMEEVPADVKAVVAASVVQLTFWQEDYLLNKFEYIIVYPHPFPSPQYPEQWHACEIFEEDGVIMFSAEQLMAGFAQPEKFFHIGLYEYTKVFMRCHPEITMPGLPVDIWEKLELISGFPKEAVEKWVGLNDLNVMAVAVAHWFVFGDRFRVVMPELYQAIGRVLGSQIS